MTRRAVTVVEVRPRSGIALYDGAVEENDVVFVKKWPLLNYENHPVVRLTLSRGEKILVKGNASDWVGPECTCGGERK